MRHNEPKHRQVRARQRLLARKRASRAGLPAILIVCEGRETEPNYLRGLCDANRINLANVRIESGNGETDAPSLVKKAQTLFKRDNDYDAVYVVCDDEASQVARAKELAMTRLKNAEGNILSVDVIASTPCFEYWLLLHFEYSARAYATAAEVTRDLRRYVPDYEKSDRQIFAKVGAGLEAAQARGLRLKADLAATEARSPDTDMGRLVEQLLSIRRVE